jgi:hypothetical protein
MFLRQLAIEVFIVAAIGAVLGLLGPFGTYAMPAALRFAYWIGFILVGYAIYRPVQAVAIWLARETAIPIWGALLLAAGLASLPLTALLGFAIDGMHWDSGVFGSGFAIFYLQVLGIGIGIQIAMWLLFGERGSGQPRVAVEPLAAPIPLDINAIPMPEQPSAPFFDRLSPRLGRNIVCLEMQDHYVRAHTLSGSEMILMRLRDAIAELDGIEGMQVHRSWWVARDSVRAIRREGRAVKLELANGLLAPVSRNRQEALKRNGWF